MDFNAMIGYLNDNDTRYFHWAHNPGESELVVDLYDYRGGEWILRVSADDDWNILSIARTELTFDEELEDAVMRSLIRHKDGGVLVLGKEKLSVDNLKDFICARIKDREEEGK